VPFTQRTETIIHSNLCLIALARTWYLGFQQLHSNCKLNLSLWQHVPILAIFGQHSLTSQFQLSRIIHIDCQHRHPLIKGDTL